MDPNFTPNAIVTGANAGIGYQTALELAKSGLNLLLVCRNQEKGKAALDQLKQASGNPNIDLVLCDFASQEATRKAAAQIREKWDRLDILVNNAGLVSAHPQSSAEGIELTFAVNHLGYFLFTLELLPLLQNASAARIVNVSSKANYGGKIHFGDLALEKEGYSGMKAYRQSKLANVLFTVELARRLKDQGITVNCLHPGVVRTRIGNKTGGGFYDLVWSLLKPFMITPQKGAETSVYLALSPEVAGITGKYFDNCREKAPNPVANDPEVARRLWKLSLELTGMEDPL